eukprot:TRINITY_DN6485_c0_g1_i2.p1 TRINITY_DN6485_c0_g1~~TRINITY_DN6485_c0_g1_i2.p1  ORF type:complete len:733 (-),score=92.34 TRINITY_DN6485_c0_g1_i2:80-2278(-)
MSIPSLTLLLVVVLGIIIVITPTHHVYGATFSWRSVPIGGGGYVTGLALHHTTKNVLYARCDVGGSYHFNFTGRYWIPITDSFSNKDPYYTESIAIDEGDTSGNTVYIATGNSGKNSFSDVYMSTNAGQSWVPTGLANKVSFFGNADLRWQGERLLVDPFNSSLLYYGSRNEGLWRGITTQPRSGKIDWVQVSGFPFGTVSAGVQFVVCGDVASLRSPPRRPSCALLFIGVIGSGVYRVNASNPSDLSWKLEEGSPSTPARASLSPDGSLYVTAAAEGVKKRDAMTGTWTSITPDTKLEYNAITVDPFNAKHIIVGSYAIAFNNPYFVSETAGASWTLYDRSHGTTIDLDVSWWSVNRFLSAVSTILFDPLVPNQAYNTDWFGMYFGSNMEASSTGSPHVWQTHESGHEELVNLALCAPPHVPLISGHADLSAFLHKDIENWPLKTIENIPTQNTLSFDYMAKDSHYMALTMTTSHTPTKDGDGGGLFSVDGGVSWTGFKTQQGYGGRVAVAADTQTIIWIPMGKTGYYSTNNGSTWTTCSGLSSSIISPTSIWLPSQPLSADRIMGSSFYVLDGDVLKGSNNTGKSFEPLVTLPKKVTPSWKITVQVNPLKAGDVWISLDEGGLFHWTSSSPTSLQHISDVTTSNAIAFGKASPSSPSIPTLFLQGSVNSYNGIFYSLDLAQSWVQFQDGTGVLWAKGSVLAADFNVWGRVYVGTSGRGVMVGEPSSSSSS